MSVRTVQCRLSSVICEKISKDDDQLIDNTLADKEALIRSVMRQERTCIRSTVNKFVFQPVRLNSITFPMTALFGNCEQT